MLLDIEQGKGKRLPTKTNPAPMQRPGLWGVSVTCSSVKKFSCSACAARKVFPVPGGPIENEIARDGQVLVRSVWLGIRASNLRRTAVRTGWVLQQVPVSVFEKGVLDFVPGGGWSVSAILHEIRFVWDGMKPDEIASQVIKRLSRLLIC
jgi:hypothetical protein